MKVGIERPIPQCIYNVALAVRRWVLRQSDGGSAGWCGDAADEICERLEGTRYRPKVCCGGFLTDGSEDCDGEGHCWVRFGRVILDVTADQFNPDLKGTGIKMAPIVYGTRTELQKRYVED